jgi:2-dehydropantoate 2-reductase
MGCLYATLLARQAAVTIIDPWAEQIEAIRRHGLTLVGIGGELRPRLDARHADDADRLVGSADIAFSLVNANTTPAAAAIAAKVLSRDGFVVTLQNGIGNIEALEQSVGRGRVMAGLSYHSAAIRGLALVEHTHEGPTWIGEIDGSRGERLRRLVLLLEGAGAQPRPVDDIVSWVWTKFIHNCAINAVCAVAGLRVGEIPTTPGAADLQTRIIEECLAVVSAKGITLADATPLRSIRDFCRVKFNKPSMLQHLEANRTTEIAALNGAVVRLGAELGISTPYNQAITWMVQSVEHHRMFAAAHPDFDYPAAERAAKEGSP